jgi:hypothetical protein
LNRFLILMVPLASAGNPSLRTLGNFYWPMSGAANADIR